MMSMLMKPRISDDDMYVKVCTLTVFFVNLCLLPYRLSRTLSSCLNVVVMDDDCGPGVNHLKRVVMLAGAPLGFFGTLSATEFTARDMFQLYDSLL